MKQNKPSINEDAILSEKSSECIVKVEGNKFAVYEKDDNIWLATFANELIAKDFANDYPKLKTKYIKDNEKNKMVEKTPKTEKDIFEEELNKDIEMALREIYR